MLYHKHHLEQQLCIHEAIEDPITTRQSDDAVKQRVGHDQSLLFITGF